MRSVFRKRSYGLLAVLLGGFLFLGCGGDARDEQILKARRAVKAQNYDQAIEHFDAVLKLNAEDYGALWGKADTYRRSGHLAEQAKVLEQIMTVEALAKDFSGVVKPALEENYRKQASVGGDIGETFLRKAIKLNRRSEAHQELGKLLVAKADGLLRKGEFLEAKKVFDQAHKLRLRKKMKAQISGKAEIAEFMAWRKAFAPRFNKVKPDLVKAGIFDEEARTFTVEGLAEVDGKPKDEGYEANAERSALIAVTEALNLLSWQVTGTPRPVGARVAAYSASLVTIVSKGFTKDKKPRKYSFKVSLPADAVFGEVQRIDAFMAWQKTFAPRFDKVKPALITAGAYNDETRIFTVESTVEVQGTPKDAGYEANASGAAMTAAAKALDALTWQVAGKVAAKGARAVTYTGSLVSIVASGLVPEQSPAKYSVKIAVPAGAVFERVRDIDDGKFKPVEKKATKKAPAKKAEKAPAKKAPAKKAEKAEKAPAKK